MAIAERTKEQAKPAEREAPQRAPANGRHDELAALARAVGNRGMRQLISRDETAVKDKPKEKPKKDPVQYNLPAGQYEYAIKKKWGDRLSISAKITSSFQKTKVVQAKAGDDSKSAAVSVWESKLMRERAGGKSVDKIQAALLRGELSGEIAPGLRLKANTKLLEMQVEQAKSDVDFALITVSVLIEGDITQWFFEAAGVPEDQRAGVKITITGEAKVAPQLSDIARIRDMQRARKQAMAAASEVEKAAKRAKTVQTELEAAEKAAKGLEEKTKDFKKWDAKAKRQYKSHKAWKKAERETASKLKTAAEKKLALETEKAALKATLKAQTEILQHSQGVIAKAASGLKSKAGALMGKALATSAGKFIAKKLLYAIPILNVLAIAWDIVEIGSLIYKLWNGAKLGFGGDGGDSEGKEGAQGSGGGDSKAPADAGGGGTGGDKDTPGSGGTGKVPDVVVPEPPRKAPDGGTQGGPSDAPADAPALPPAPPLHAGAQSVAEALKSGGIQLDKDQVWQLEDVIPKDFTADQMKELLKRLEAMKGGTGAQDPYELLGNIQAEVEKVRRGHDTESELTWVDGEFSEVLSTGAPADVLKQEAAAEEAKDQPPATGGGAKDAGAKTPDAAGEPAKKPPPKKGPKAAKAPTSLMPDLPSGYLTFDDKANKFDWAPGGHDLVTGQFYNLSDGLEVAVLRAEMDQQLSGDVILLNLGFEVEVQTLPAKAGKDYPWKVGDKKIYYERYSYNTKTGAIGELQSNTAGTSAARAALALKGDTVVLAGKTVSFGKGVSVRVDSISDQSREEHDDSTEFTVTMHVTVTAAPKDGHSLVDVDQNHVTLLKGKQAKIRMSIYRDKPKAKSK